MKLQQFNWNNISEIWCGELEGQGCYLSSLRIAFRYHGFDCLENELLKRAESLYKNTEYIFVAFIKLSTSIFSFS